MHLLKRLTTVLRSRDVEQGKRYMGGTARLAVLAAQYKLCSITLKTHLQPGRPVVMEMQSLAVLG